MWPAQQGITGERKGSRTEGRMQMEIWIAKRLALMVNCMFDWKRCCSTAQQPSAPILLSWKERSSKHVPRKVEIGKLRIEQKQNEQKDKMEGWWKDYAFLKQRWSWWGSAGGPSLFSASIHLQFFCSFHPCNLTSSPPSQPLRLNARTPSSSDFQAHTFFFPYYPHSLHKNKDKGMSCPKSTHFGVC